MKLKEFMSTYSVPGVDYYVTTKTSYVFIGNRDEFEKYAALTDKLAIKNIRHNLHTTTSKLKIELEKGGSKVEMLNKRIAELKDKLANYVSICDREVTDVSRIIYGTKIVIEGNEKGRFYTKGEFLKEIKNIGKTRK